MRAPFLDLLVLPCAGASATMYLRWRRLLPEWIRLVPVELPGRGSRLGELHVRDFDALATQLCDEHAASLQGRHALFGHSMGALLALGMAQRQHRLGRPLPRLLCASASPAPSRRDPARFAGLHGDEALIADLRRQGGTPAEVFDSPELLRLTLDTLDADYRVCESFVPAAPAAPLAVPLQVFAGRDDDIAPDRIDAWRLETTGPCDVAWFDGGHFYLRAQEQALLTAIVRALSRQFSGVGHASAAAV